MIQADNRNKNPLAAGREVLERIQENLNCRRTFAVETTLSGKMYLQTMANARNLGFQVNLIYVCTSDVKIHLARVAARVELSGHNVPETDIRRRYQRSLDNLPVAAHRANLALIFDNSRPVIENPGSHAYHLAAVIENGQPTWFPPIPAWLAPLRASFEG